MRLNNALLSAMAAVCLNANAAMITDVAQMTGITSTVTFDQFETKIRSKGPLHLGQDVTFDGIGPSGYPGSDIGTQTIDLGLNGRWDHGKTPYLLMNGVSGTEVRFRRAAKDEHYADAGIRGSRIVLYTCEDYWVHQWTQSIF